MRPQTWTVGLTLEHTKDITADHVLIGQSGTLTFFDERRTVVYAFAPQTWLWLALKLYAATA